MRIFRTLLILASCILIEACASDDVDNAPERGIVVTTSDITTTLVDNAINGDVVANITGRTNNGQVFFAITSQTPEGAFAIDEIVGELIVADETLIDSETNPEINLVVTITNANVSKTSNVTVMVTPAPVDNDGDGVFSDIDPDDSSPCFPVQNPGYIDFDVTNTIWMMADCDDDGVSNIDEVSNGTDPYLGEVTTCDSTVDTSIWAGALAFSEETPFGPFDYDSTADAIAGCGTLIIPDPNGFGPCDGNEFEILFTLTPDFDGATTGTIEALEQPYVCDFINATFQATGTYDETTQTIVIDYTSDGFSATITVTPR